MMFLDLTPAATYQFTTTQEQEDRIDAQQKFNHIQILCNILHKTTELDESHIATGVQNIAYQAKVASESLANYGNEFQRDNRIAFASYQLGVIDAAINAVKMILTFLRAEKDQELYKTVETIQAKYKELRESIKLY